MKRMKFGKIYNKIVKMGHLLEGWLYYNKISNATGIYYLSGGKL